MAILVYITNVSGQIKKQSLELTAYARSMAVATQQEVVGVVIGEIADEKLKPLGLYGMNRVLKANNPRFSQRVNRVYTRIVEQAAVETQASHILFPDNAHGKAVAPRLSIRLMAGYIPQVLELPSSYAPFTVKKRAFTGKALASVTAKTERIILSLMQNSFGLKEMPMEITLQPFEPSIEEPHSRLSIVDKQLNSEGVQLADADIVVSGGRGLKTPENFTLIEELATTLGAATACSRPVADDGWRPADEHVGQTGKIIAPNIYFAVGISGAIQHVAGVSGAKCIVGINSDAEAPIFEVADYGLVGDALQIIPELNLLFRKHFQEQH